MPRVFFGAATALVTPFTDDGIALGALEKLVDWQIVSGVDALVLNGTTGEASTQTSDEKESVIRAGVAAAAGRVPVIAGTGGNDTARVIEDSRRAKAAGADALLVVTPYYNKTTAAGLIAHYGAVCAGASLPVIVYNVPSRTGLNVSAQVMAQLSRIDGIVGVKEASGDIKQVGDVARLCGDGFDVYAGSDDYVVPMLACGGAGVISTAGNIAPAEMSAVCALWAKGRMRESLAMQRRLNPLIDALFCEVNPIPVKTALRLMGFEVGPLRLPLVEMAPGNLAYLKREMAVFGLLEDRA